MYPWQTGGGTVQYALATWQSSASTFTQNSTQTRTQQTYSDAEFSEEGTYANGCFAFASVVWQAYTGSAATNQQHVIGRSTQTSVQGSSNSQSNSGVNTDVGYASPMQQETSSNASSTTTTTYQYSNGVSNDYTFNSTEVYEAGSSGPGGWSLSSVYAGPDGGGDDLRRPDRPDHPGRPPVVHERQRRLPRRPDLERRLAQLHEPGHRHQRPVQRRHQLLVLDAVRGRRGGGRRAHQPRLRRPTTPPA